MDLPPFAVTWDYLCPFARNAHEHLLTALEGGAEWDVTFAPFSLMQSHVEEGETPVWELDEKPRGVLALEAGIVVRDRFADRFLATHRAFFAARHDEGRDLADPEVVRDVLARSGVPADEVLDQIADGWPLEELRRAHEAAVADHQVFGVPTFIVGDEAAFVRLMNRPAGDVGLAQSTVERLIRLVVDQAEINELKHTTVPR